MVQQPTDATLPTRVIAEPNDAAAGLTVGGDFEQPELRTLVRATLAELERCEREVTELSLRHDHYDTDLATALGVSCSEAHALSSRARHQLEKAVGIRLAAHTGRQVRPALGDLLADGMGS